MRALGLTGGQAGCSQHRELAWPACPVHPGSGTECRRRGSPSAQRLQPGDLPSHASVLGALPGAGLEGLGLPSSTGEGVAGTPPQRVGLQAWLGLAWGQQLHPFTCNRSCCSLAAQAGMVLGALPEPQIESGCWSQPDLGLNPKCLFPAQRGP